MTSLSARRVGALVVLERREGLKTYIENGSPIDAAVSYELLVTLFAPGTPLHDGAVIVSGDRIAAAASFLPLSLKEGLPKRFGTRHRAAIGISEETDALAILVSEERGTICLARSGELQEDLDAKSLRDLLFREFAAYESRPMQISRVLFRNLGTKLLALAIACATWYVLTGQRRERISERNYRIPLSIVNVPRGTMVVSPLPDAVDVRIRGAFTPLRALDPAKLEAVVDLADATPGEKRYPLGPEDINVPADVEVIAIAPAEIRLVLDARGREDPADHRRPGRPARAGRGARGRHDRAAQRPHRRARKDPRPDGVAVHAAGGPRRPGRPVLGDHDPRPSGARACAFGRASSSRFG